MTTDWNKIGENAADKTDKELAAGIERLITSDIGKLFPVPADAAKVRLLCQQIRVKTAYNERVAAFKAISVTLGADLLKSVLKVMAGLMLALLIGMGRVEAQEVARDTSLFNFGDFFQSIRAGYGIDQKGQKSDIYYTAFQRYHNKVGVDFLTLNIGYNGAEQHPVFMTGIRLDNIIPLIWGGSWGKAHVTTAKLPTFEFGPFVSAWPKSSADMWHLEIKYGLGIAIGFPK